MLEHSHLSKDSESDRLYPSRAALFTAIKELEDESSRLQGLHAPLSALERALLAAEASEAAELRSEISRLLHGVVGSDRPATTNALGQTGSALIDAAEGGHLIRLADNAAEAGRRLAAAREDYAHSAERVRAAVFKRDQALWCAAIEAAEGDLRELEEAVSRVLGVEARLRSLILALREIGERCGSGERGAFAAAEKIESRAAAARRGPSSVVGLTVGRSLIERLRNDPWAQL